MPKRKSTPQQKISDYTAGPDYRIERYQRTDYKLTNKRLREGDEDAANLDDLFSMKGHGAYKTKKPLIVYRANRGPMEDSYTKKRLQKVGQEIIVSQYVSTSFSNTIAREFMIETPDDSYPYGRCCLYEIYLPKNLPVLLTKRQANLHDEKELILFRNTMFKLKGIRRHKHMTTLLVDVIGFNVTRKPRNENVIRNRYEGDEQIVFPADEEHRKEEEHDDDEDEDDRRSGEDEDGKDVGVPFGSFNFENYTAPVIDAMSNTEYARRSGQHEAIDALYHDDHAIVRYFGLNAKETIKKFEYTPNDTGNEIYVIDQQ